MYYNNASLLMMANPKFTSHIEFLYLNEKRLYCILFHISMYISIQMNTNILNTSLDNIYTVSKNFSMKERKLENFRD